MADPDFFQIRVEVQGPAESVSDSRYPRRDTLAFFELPVTGTQAFDIFMAALTSTTAASGRSDGVV